MSQGSGIVIPGMSSEGMVPVMPKEVIEARKKHYRDGRDVIRDLDKYIKSSDDEFNVVLAKAIKWLVRSKMPFDELEENLNN